MCDRFSEIKNWSQIMAQNSAYFATFFERKILTD